MTDTSHAARPVAARAGAPLIELAGIHKHYGDYHALRGIDLTIRQGEFFSLLGPSGCGKTTLLRTIAGFEAPSQGTLRIAGQDMARVPANERPTNMVFQSYAIFPHLSVAENVGFGLRREGGGRDDDADDAQGDREQERQLEDRPRVEPGQAEPGLAGTAAHTGATAARGDGCAGLTGAGLAGAHLLGKGVS